MAGRARTESGRVREGARSLALRGRLAFRPRFAVADFPDPPPGPLETVRAAGGLLVIDLECPGGPPAGEPMPPADGPMHERLARALAKIEPFTELDPRSLDEVAKFCRFERYEAKHQIIAYQDDSAEVFFIVSGKVRIVIHSFSGKEISYRDLGSGEMFGELAAIDGEQRSASVVAVTETLLIVMSAAAFRDAIRRHPSMAEAVLQRLTRLVRLYSQRLYEMRTLDVQSRIRAELLRLAQASLAEDNTATISPLPTSADIAARVNTRREAVSRELASLTRQGLIKRQEKSLMIRDFAGLNQLVESMLGE